jgi:hypothetical protein
LGFLDRTDEGAVFVCDGRSLITNSNKWLAKRCMHPRIQVRALALDKLIFSTIEHDHLGATCGILSLLFHDGGATHRRR